MNKKIHIPNEHELQQLNMYEKIGDDQIPISVKRIYRLQGWCASSLNKRMPGVSQNTWRQYGQVGWERTRMLHVLAVLSWASQTSMSAFYHGENLNAFWTGVDQTIISCITYTSSLPTVNYELLLRLIISQNKLDPKACDFENRIAELNGFDDHDFLMPQTIDVDAFKREYYQSIAVNLKKFRAQYNLSAYDLARVLGITVKRYYRYEVEDDPVSIPASLGIRLKLGFKLQETFELVSSMDSFKGFYFARQIQEKRERLIISLMGQLEGECRTLTEVFIKAAGEYLTSTPSMYALSGVNSNKLRLHVNY